jgi:hypothetical protein
MDVRGVVFPRLVRLLAGLNGSSELGGVEGTLANRKGWQGAGMNVGAVVFVVFPTSDNRYYGN